MNREPTAPRFSRRRFAALLGSTGLAAPALHANQTAASKTEFSKSSDPATDPLFMSATKLAQSIREKKLSAQEAVHACLARMEKVNPRLNAVVQLCAERALAEAREADALLAKGRAKGPLHGVPMTIKDSFDTAGVVSTGGTLGRRNYIPARDATVVARLRDAGAILLGKTNTPEFTLSFVTSNLIHGATKNPYNLGFQPSGSSGGAAAIVAAGGSPFDIGSDFAGSIRMPAHACGIAGLKPTAGRVPRTGHIVGYGGAFDAMQQIGPLARRVEDLALLLSVIAGPDGEDASIAPVPLGDPQAVDLKTLKVAYFTTNGDIDPSPEIQRAVQDCAGMMSALGAKVTESSPPRMKEVTDLRRELSGADGRAHVRRLISAAGTRETSPQLSLSGEARTVSRFTELVEKLDACRSELLAFLETFDVILCPVSPSPAPPLDKPSGPAGSYTSLHNVTGWPAAVVRAGTSPEGLPLGVQIVGRPWADHVVLAVAASIESKTGGWQKPAL